MPITCRVIMNSIFLDLASATKIDLQRHWIEAKRIYPCTGKFKLICILQVLKWVGLLYGMSGLGWSRTQHAPLCEELKLPMFLKFFQVLPYACILILSGAPVRYSILATQQLIRYNCQHSIVCCDNSDG